MHEEAVRLRVLAIKEEYQHRDEKKGDGIPGCDHRAG